MFEACAIPYLRKLSDELIVSHAVRIFGMGESAVDDLFADEMNRMTNPTMAPYAKECDCLLQITAKAGSEAEAEAMIAPVMAHVMERLGDVVYGVDIECLEEAVMALLKEKKLSFSAAESCTGGDIARRFTELPGASAFFKGGVVSYVNEVKEAMLGVDSALLEEKTAVCREVAAAMAEGVRARLHTDLAVSVTGLAGPDGDGVHEVGTVFIGLAAPDDTAVRQLALGTGRDRIRTLAAHYAFDMLRRYLTDLPIY
jgi:nicotinamide-nucleotide amidase